MLKRCKIVMLPTDNEAELGQFIIMQNNDKVLTNPNIIECGIKKFNADPQYFPEQHLYILSDDEMKAGDWTLTNPKGKDNSRPFKVDSYDFCTGVNYANERYKSYSHLKIIASTDPSLNLPSPSKAFIQKYCDKGGIDEVMVEYVEDWVFCNNQWSINNGYPRLEQCPDCEGKSVNILGGCTTKMDNGFKLKTKNNQITIKPIPIVNYNRDKVIKLCQEAMIVGVKSMRNGTSFNEDFLKFVEDKL